MNIYDSIVLYLYDVAHVDPMKYTSYTQLYSQIEKSQNRLTTTEFTAALRYLVGKKYIQEEAAHYRLISDGEEYAYKLLYPPPNYEKASFEEQKRGNQNNVLLAFIAIMVSCIGIIVAIMLSRSQPQSSTISSQDEIIQNQPTSQFDVYQEQPTLIYFTPVTTKPSPTEFVISYWENVSDRNFESSWMQLSPAFRQNKHNNDYADYLLGYQDMKLCRISVSNVNLLAEYPDSAIVAAHLIYYTGTQCNSSEYDFEIELVYDNSTNSWLYDKTTNK